ncbi:unnamed protein product, partial [marine sediment metagenome]
IWWGIGFDPYRQKTPDAKPNGMFARFIIGLKDAMLRRADAVMLYSDEGKRYAIRKGVDPEKIFVLHNSLHVEEMWRLEKLIRPEEIQSKRTEWGLSEKSCAFLFVGRLHPRKEVPFLIQSYATVADKLKDSKLIIVGDGEERSESEALIASLGLEKQVIMLGAIYDELELAKVFMASDVVTLPGQVGLAVVHSFAYGKPVVTRVSDSYSPELENLIDGQNGIRLASDEPASYGKALEKICLDKSFRGKLSQGAKEQVKEVTMQKMADGFRQAVLFTIRTV